MLGRLNHIAIAVPDIISARLNYQKSFMADVSNITPLPEHGVSVVFINLINTKIELIHPLGDNSPIKKFLEKNPDGGIHHICYEVNNIIKVRDHLIANGYRILGHQKNNAKPTIGAHEKPVLFLHPKDFHGTLIELEQA
ncbi:MAG: methylmalonyl-CoA epimerase [Alphaproteobacteria bacterium]